MNSDVNQSISSLRSGCRVMCKNINSCEKSPAGKQPKADRPPRLGVRVKGKGLFSNLLSIKLQTRCGLLP